MPALLGSVMGSAVLRVASLSAIFGLCAVPLAAAVAAVLLLIPADLEAAEFELSSPAGGGGGGGGSSSGGGGSADCASDDDEVGTNVDAW